MARQAPQQAGWQPDLNWITSKLAVGGSFPQERAEPLARVHGIGAVVDLRQEERDDERLLHKHGIALLHLPTEDMCGVAAAHLDSGVAFACEHLDAGTRVLVHCEHGIGRSATLALCVMVRRGWAPMDALLRMKDRRALVSPSREQFECWSAWLERHRAARDDLAWAVPAYEAFGMIAYRHLAKSG
jgi:protein-tyrosine phosphatase